MDLLASKPKKMTFKKFKTPIEPWQLITAASLSDCQDEENYHKEIEEQNFVLNRHCRLGTLCKWTGTERKGVISLATAIDSIINILPMDLDPDTENVFPWVLEFKAGETIQQVSVISDLGVRFWSFWSFGVRCYGSRLWWLKPSSEILEVALCWLVLRPKANWWLLHC